MFRRLFTTALWFATIWFAYEVAWSVTQVPRIVGPMIAIAVAAFVFVDPLAWFWPSVDRPSRVDTHQSFESPVSPGVTR